MLSKGTKFSGVECNLNFTDLLRRGSNKHSHFVSRDGVGGKTKGKEATLTKYHYVTGSHVRRGGAGCKATGQRKAQ